MTSLDAVLRRDRVVVFGSLALLCSVTWAHLAYETGGMMQMAAMPKSPAAGLCACMIKPQAQTWGAHEFIALLVMWVVMMVAMMTPSAMPMVLVFASLHRKRREQQQPFVPTSLFLSGYLVVWAVFSIAATIAQWELHRKALLSPMMISTSPWLGSALLLTAGLFQWTALKHACLKHCRSPLSFLMTDWREGRWGAFLMGLRHGIYCTGCCWILMALLFVGGVMNLVWIALLSGFVLLEKAAPHQKWASRFSGLLLIGWAAWLLTAVRT